MSIQIQCKEHPKYRGLSNPKRRYSKRLISSATRSWRGGQVHTERKTGRKYVEPCDSCLTIYELVHGGTINSAEDNSDIVAVAT